MAGLFVPGSATSKEELRARTALPWPQMLTLDPYLSSYIRTNARPGTLYWTSHLEAQAAGPGVRKRSLTGRRRAPGDLAPQEDDPGRREAQLDPLGAAPAFVPARILADLGSNQMPGPSGSSTPS